MITDGTVHLTTWLHALSIHRTCCSPSGLPSNTCCFKRKNSETKGRVFERSLISLAKGNFPLLLAALCLWTQAKEGGGEEGDEAVRLIRASSLENPSRELRRRQVKCCLDSSARHKKAKLTDFDLKRVKPNLSSAAENQVKPPHRRSFLIYPAN